MTTFILALVLVLFSALYVLRAWKSGRFGMKDRVTACAETVGLLALFTFLQFGIGWAGVPTLLWIVAVALFAAGAAGIAWRFASLPWLRTRRRLWWRITRLAVSALACGAVFLTAALAY